MSWRRWQLQSSRLTGSPRSSWTAKPAPSPSRTTSWSSRRCSAGSASTRSCCQPSSSARSSDFMTECTPSAPPATTTPASASCWWCERIGRPKAATPSLVSAPATSPS
ncbi:unnamed protein product [Effrenium voratum]|nr:unnamed protein product [Effrenium voratum]